MSSSEPASKKAKLGEGKGLATKTGTVMSCCDDIHFKGQDYDKLRAECLKAKKLFQDDLFPANQSSLGEGPDFEGVEWKRPADIACNPRLFVDGAYVHDVCQGCLSNSWFVSAMGVIASHKGYWQKVIPDYCAQEWDSRRPEKYAGIFKFRFWRYGKWIQIVIDDLLPTKNNRLIFVSSRTSNEFWSALVEKAYAKLIGNYKMLEGGFCEEALVDFTGGMPEVLTNLQESYSTEEERLNLFRFLEREYNNKSLICAATPSRDGETEAVCPNGLITTHAYSVTCVRETKTQGTGFFFLFNREKLFMVRLRNPWGAKEWNGAFSDNSPEWDKISKKERELMGLNVDDDGEFWMRFEDFAQEFGSVTVLRLANSSLLSLEKEWHETTVSGHFGPAAKYTQDTLLNPQLGFHVSSDDELLMHLIQVVPRHREIYFGVMLLQMEMGRKTRLNDIHWGDVVSKFAIDGQRAITTRSCVKAGCYIAVPYLLREPPVDLHPVPFVLRIFTSAPNRGRILPADLPKMPFKKQLPCFSKPPVAAITRITIVKAKNLDTSLERGKADPYVIVTCETKSYRTKFIKDTVDPRWDEDFLFYRSDATRQPIRFQIYNYNRRLDDFMGQCELAFDCTLGGTEVSRRLPLKGKNPEDPDMPGTLCVRVVSFASPDDL